MYRFLPFTAIVYRPQDGISGATGAATVGGHDEQVGPLWLFVALAVVAAAAGAALLPSDSLSVHTVGPLLSSVVPAVLLGIHGQRLQRRARRQGIYPSTLFIWSRRVLTVCIVALAALHGYQFALALERAVVS